MVNLGLIKDLESCPDHYPRLFFQLPPQWEDQGPILTASPEQGQQIWKLFFPKQESTDLASWVNQLAQCLQNLRQPKWCVNTQDLVRVVNLPLDLALTRWGDLFWPQFNQDTVFIFATHEDTSAVREILSRWHKTRTNLCLRKHYDLTQQDKGCSITASKQEKGNNRHKLKFPAFLLKTRRSKP